MVQVLGLLLIHHYREPPNSTFLVSGNPGRFSLRLGHSSALTVHRTVIHYLGAATLPFSLRRRLSRAAAERIFTPHRLTLALKGNKRRIDTDRIAEIVSKLA